MEQLQGVNQLNALMNTDGSISALGGWVSQALVAPGRVEADD